MGVLYIVPTPIGNLRDITLRAIDVLKEAKTVLSEDTRVTKKLLSLLEIDYSDKEFISFFDHNEERKIPLVIDLLTNGNDVVLVSDAGTPLLNDPGFKLVREIRKLDQDIKIEVLPGATSITTALVASGLPTDKFTFVGYFPRKKGKKENLLKDLSKINETLKVTYIGFESPYRLISTLEIIENVYKDNCAISVCNDLTKMYEFVITGKPKDVLTQIKSKSKLKGEFIVLFHID